MVTTFVLSLNGFLSVGEMCSYIKIWVVTASLR